MKSDILNKFLKTTTATAIALSSISLMNVDNANAATQLPSDFNSIPTYAQSTVERLYDAKLISGFPDGTFRPSSSLTRAEFVGMILQTYNYEENPNKINTSFADRDSMSLWEFTVMKQAYLAGLINGTNTTVTDNGTLITLDGNKIITRQEMAGILLNAYNLAYSTRTVPADSVDSVLSRYSKDKNTISAWAKTSMATAVNEGLIVGNSPNTINPLGIATRTEGAVLMQRLMDKINNLPSSIVVDSGTTISQFEDLFYNDTNLPNHIQFVTYLGTENDKSTIDYATSFNKVELVHNGNQYKFGDYLIKAKNSAGKEVFIPLKINSEDLYTPEEKTALASFTGPLDESQILYGIDWISNESLVPLYNVLKNTHGFTDIKIYDYARKFSLTDNTYNETTLINSNHELYFLDSYSNIRKKVELLIP